MNLRAKKQLAARTFGVGKERITFVNERMDEIKEAITKQDMRNLQKDGTIIIKEVKGRKKNIKKSRKRGIGKVRRKVNTRKRDYVILTRKLRKVVAEKKKKGEMSKEEVKEIRKKIRNKLFKSKAHLKENMGNFKK
jgi:large subunit ribosomal protein L19e